MHSTVFAKEAYLEDLPRIRFFARVASGVIGFFIPALFAWDIYSHHLVENVATWSMVLALDALGLTLAIKAGGEELFLQIGWFLAAACIVAAIVLSHSQWHWTWVETVSLLCCATAVVLWLTKDAEWGLWPYMAAVYISFIPQAIDFWWNPQPGTLWMWAWTIVGCVLAILGARKRDFANTFVPWASIVLNALICILILA